MKTGVPGFNAVLDLRYGHPLIVQLARFQRNVLTHCTAFAMLILETEEIVLMAEAGHAAAKARQLLENFRNVFCNLVGCARFLVCKQGR